MKKRILLVLLVLILTACSSGASNIMQGYQGFDKKDHHFVTKDYVQIIDDITSNKPGVYYMGFKECPWCIALVPVFEEVATELDSEIVYLNTRDDKYSKDTKEMERLNTYIASLPKDLQNDGKVPFIISISKDGLVKTHLGTAPNHEAPNQAMTESQVSYLKARLTELFNNAK